MPRDLEQLLVDSAVRPSRPVDLDAIERGVRRRRAARWASGGVGAAALIAVVVAVVVASPPSRPAIDTPVTRPTTPAPVVTEPPSQSPEDAARDGVVPAVAALPFDQRVVVQTGHDGEPLRIPLDGVGVWVVSGLARTSVVGDELLLGDHDQADAVHGRDFVHVIEYSEVLLLDASETTILRAFPMPGLPTTELEVGDDAVYCSRQGDGGLPDSHLCRIDLRTYAWSVRVFPCSDCVDPVDVDVAYSDAPTNWVIDSSGTNPVVSDLLATRGRLLRVSESPTEPLTAFDPVTLEVIDPATVGAARDFGRVTAIDGVAGTVTIDRARMVDDPEEDAGYRIDDVPGEATYPTIEHVGVTMTLYWDYDSGPERHRKPISWADFARIWDDDATDVYPAQDVEYARGAYYRLLIVDGEVVRIEQQYLP